MGKKGADLYSLWLLVSLKLIALEKRIRHEYLRPVMSSSMNMVNHPMCLLSFLEDEHRGISYPTRDLNETEKGYGHKWQKVI